MSIIGFELSRYAVAAALMVVCGGAIGRLMWRLDGSPPLERPSWWPRSATAEPATAGVPPLAFRAPAAFAAPTVATPSAPPARLRAIGACAVCCGAPLLLLAGIVSFGAATAVGVSAGALVLATVLAWAALTGRIKRPRRPRGASGGCSHTSVAVPPPARSCCPEPPLAERAGDPG